MDLEFEYVIADRSYAAKVLGTEILVSGAQAVIPPKKNAKEPQEYDTWRYQERSLIECFIGKIKQLGRVCSRFDKLTRRYPGFLQLTSSLIWLR